MHMEKVPPQVTHSQVEEPLKASEEMSVQELMEELSVAADRQAKLVAHLKVQYAGEGSSSAQKDEEIALLKAQLASAQAKVGSTSVYAGKLANEKMLLLAQVNQKRAAFDQYKSNCM